MTRTHRRIVPLLLMAVGLLQPTPAQAGWNDDLAAIDVQIRAVTGATYQQGNAVNVLPGVTTAVLEQKRLILVDAGFTWFAPAGGTGAYDYANFFSFTGQAGQTDTQLRIVETTGPTLLYRRGYPNEPARRLGAWWADTYLSTDATRDELAVLAAWGNPLTGIYVVSVPAGTPMITGLTSPMQAGTESRAGGAEQFWLNTRDNNWLVHALYAPDYLGSYVLAVAGAQKLNRDTLDGLATQLRDFATSDDRENASGEKKFDCWLRTTTSDTDYQPVLGYKVTARSSSFMLGGGMTVAGTSSTARLHTGLVLGRATLRQTDDASGIEGHIDSNFGGLYAIYRRPSTERLPWYVSGSVLYGRLWFDNSVTGYLGHGLEQSYHGHTTSAALEAGMPLTLGRGWTVTPHLQLEASRAAHGDFRDALGADVSVKQGHALWTQLGAQIAKTLLRANGRHLILWVSGGAVHEFSDRNKIEVAGEAAMGRRIKAIYPIDTGLRFAWAERYSLQGSFGRVCGDERGYRGSVSLNVGW